MDNKIAILSVVAGILVIGYTGTFLMKEGPKAWIARALIGTGFVVVMVAGLTMNTALNHFNWAVIILWSGLVFWKAVQIIKWARNRQVETGGSRVKRVAIFFVFDSGTPGLKTAYFTLLFLLAVVSSVSVRTAGFFFVIGIVSRLLYLWIASRPFKKNLKGSSRIIAGRLLRTLFWAPVVFLGVTTAIGFSSGYWTPTRTQTIWILAGLFIAWFTLCIYCILLPIAWVRCRECGKTIRARAEANAIFKAQQRGWALQRQAHLCPDHRHLLDKYNWV